MTTYINLEDAKAALLDWWEHGFHSWADLNAALDALPTHRVVDVEELKERLRKRMWNPYNGNPQRTTLFQLGDVLDILDAMTKDEASSGEGET